jgi:hypothetical protein
VGVSGDLLGLRRRVLGEEVEVAVELALLDGERPAEVKSPGVV